MTPMTTKIPFTVIGGYLGAGKTTLLNHLLSNTQGLRIAVLVNDFGSVNIDASLIRSHEGDTINLSNGCMCCSIADNFALVMGQLQRGTSNFDHIVIEASGVANPGKIAQYGQMYQLPLDGIIVVADAEQVRTQAQNKYVGDTVLRQFEQADLIVLNKADLVSGAALTSLRDWLGEIAPGTPVFETVNAEIPVTVLLGSHLPKSLPLPFSHGMPQVIPTPSADHAQTFETCTVQRFCPLSRKALEAIAQAPDTGVCRAKGMVYLAEDPEHRYLYQQVGARWSLTPVAPWETDQPQTQLVFIGRQGEINSQILNTLVAGDRSWAIQSH